MEDEAKLVRGHTLVEMMVTVAIQRQPDGQLQWREPKVPTD